MNASRIPTTTPYARIVELTMELAHADRMEAAEAVESAVLRMIPVGERADVPAYLVAPVLERALQSITEQREQVMGDYRVTTSEHEDCAACEAQARSAAIMAGVTGSTGATASTERRDVASGEFVTEHGATVAR